MGWVGLLRNLSKLFVTDRWKDAGSPKSSGSAKSLPSNRIIAFVYNISTGKQGHPTKYTPQADCRCRGNPCGLTLYNVAFSCFLFPFLSSRKYQRWFITMVTDFSKRTKILRHTSSPISSSPANTLLKNLFIEVICVWINPLLGIFACF